MLNRLVDALVDTLWRVFDIPWWGWVLIVYAACVYHAWTDPVCCVPGAVTSEGDTGRW